MLYYLKQEVIGSQAQKVLDGVDSSEVKIWVPEPDNSELPALWWDAISDKCLLLGVFKHGYEKYNTIRGDPTLCFLERVGKPDEKAIAAEQRNNDFMDGDVDDPEYKPAPALLKDDMEDDASSPGDLVITDSASHGQEKSRDFKCAYWPSPSVLTARLRRLITASQRYTKSRQILHIHQTQSQSSQQTMVLSAPLCPLPPTLNDTLNPKMAAKIERQQRWTRREEADFYRVVSTFGVVFDPNLGRFDWTKFRAMARLHKKTDESLQKYLCAFTAMCRRVCRLPPKEGGQIVKGFDEDSVASLSATQDETQDTHVAENGISNNSSHPFQGGGYMLAASYWPKDRVIINRLDSICQAVLKGKWPGTRRVYEPGGAVASFYTTKLLDNANSMCEDPSASPQGSKVTKHVAENKEFSVKLNDEGGLKLTFQKQGLPLKRALESEEGPQAQQQYLARLHELQSASDTGLADITKPQSSFQTGMPNGVIDGQPVVKRRRGRRKNVEGMDLLFMNKSRVPTVGMTPGPASSYSQNPSQVPADTESRVPVINLKDGTRLAGDDAPRRKELEQWLKENPGFVADTGAFICMQMQFHFQDGRPKQKRHRCRNPNKIDVNSLTGEERVQIINRRNARKIGGAFAPPLKDLCRFLQENPEYGVPPEWADVVKQSGYLPESMFDRILTGPIVPEEVSRRGRRPKNPLAKAAAAAAAAAGAPPNPAASALGLNPLLANGLLSGMDLTSLQAFQQNLQNLQSLQLTAGLMGLPSDASNLAASNLAAMFPMMLSGMAGLPNLLSMGSLLGKPAQEAAGGSEEKTKGITSEGSNTTPSSTSSSASSSSATQSASAASAASSQPLSLNPLLLSSMLYPGTLLTPGLNLPVSTTQPQSSNSDPTLPTAPPLPSVSQSSHQETEQPEGDKDGEEEDELLEDALDEGEEEEEDESIEQKDNSGPEGSGKAESSSSESGSSSSSSDDSDSSDED
uniref:Chromodomain helicase DNA binding protein 9 n=1 Tax=Haplochromis burtoni TaxID=8153 RepID=A0A3Q2W3F4_HAPBU